MTSGRFPAVEPHAEGWLDVGDGQSVWWTSSGRADGRPALILHGGPGSGSSPSTRRLFDPDVFRIIDFDQRGCGRSRPPVSDPATSLEANTTDHLVADIERLRRHLGIERWLVMGARGRRRP